MSFAQQPSKSKTILKLDKIFVGSGPTMSIHLFLRQLESSLCSSLLVGTPTALKLYTNLLMKRYNAWKGNGYVGTLFSICTKNGLFQQNLLKLQLIISALQVFVDVKFLTRSFANHNSICRFPAPSYFFDFYSS